ncbi:hypothetical protein [Streptomyces sp. x-80]
MQTATTMTNGGIPHSKNDRFARHVAHYWMDLLLPFIDTHWPVINL